MCYIFKVRPNIINTVLIIIILSVIAGAGFFATRILQYSGQKTETSDTTNSSHGDSARCSDSPTMNEQIVIDSLINVEYSNAQLLYAQQTFKIQGVINALGLYYYGLNNEYGHADFPESLGELASGLQQSYDQCNKDRGFNPTPQVDNQKANCAIFIDHIPPALDFTDVYTCQEYSYERIPNDFLLKFEIKHYDGIPAYEREITNNGVNTVSSDTPSFGPLF